MNRTENPSDKAPPAQQLAFAWSDREAPIPEPARECDRAPGVVATNASDEHEYGPGHPWHYLRQGDNAEPMPVDAIAPARDIGHSFDRELPKSGTKRLVKARELLETERKGLEEDASRYQEIVERGADALSR